MACLFRVLHYIIALLGVSFILPWHDLTLLMLFRLSASLLVIHINRIWWQFIVFCSIYEVLLTGVLFTRPQLPWLFRHMQMQIRGFVLIHDDQQLVGVCLWVLLWFPESVRSRQFLNLQPNQNIVQCLLLPMKWYGFADFCGNFWVPILGPTLNADNTSAIQIANNPVFHEQIKHIEVNDHFIQQHLLTGLIQLPHVFSQDQLVDILTKALPWPCHDFLTSKLMRHFNSHQFEGGVDWTSGSSHLTWPDPLAH